MTILGQNTVRAIGLVRRGDYNIIMGKAHENNPYRKVYEKHHGKIPKGYHVHHIDGDPWNNDPDNLVALTPEEHSEIHKDERVKWASEGGKKAWEEKLGWFDPKNRGYRKKGTPQPEGFSENQSKRLKEEYSSGKRVHWTKLYSKEEVSRRIAAGDPGKAFRGKAAWNRGKTFSNSEEAKMRKSRAALERKKTPCEICGKELDAGNMKKHIKANKCGA